MARYPEGRQEMIQVCDDLTAREAREREVRALLEAAGEHPQASPHLVGLDLPVGAELPPSVTAHAAGDWLLAPKP
ncbi:MAG: hypothetical protein NTU94_02295 [Planctomycetota bacterium]|nr:hypothetical protein [Planctomycetota bacterium]